MKNTLIALTATAVMSFGSIALADETQGPIAMTDTQMDQIVAGHAGHADLSYTDLLVHVPGRGYVDQEVGDVESARPEGAVTNYHADMINAWFAED